MKQEILIGQTDYTVLVKIRDDAGAPATGLTNASIDIAYARVETDNDVTTADVTPASLSALTDAHSDWGFIEVSATDHPGLYRLDLADAVFASGAWSAVVTITGAGLDPADMEFGLIAFNKLDAVRLGLSALPNASAGASGGLLISGSNSGTTTLGALTVTGAMTVSDGFVATCSTSNKTAFSVTGNGTGHGMLCTSGSGANGDGFKAVAASTNGNGANLLGNGSLSGLVCTAQGATGHGIRSIGGTTGAGFRGEGGSTGPGMSLVGGGTSGDGLIITTTSGHGMNIAATGASKHGITTTGGTSGTSDGIKAVAGSGGVDIRGAITGNITGALSGSVDSVTGAVGSVTGLTASDVAAIKAKTDSLTYTVAGQVDSNIQYINDVAIVGDGSGTPFNV